MVKCGYCEAGVRGEAYVYDNGAVVHPSCKAPHEANQRGKPHRCPQCNGKGTVDDERRPRYETERVPDPNYWGGHGDGMTERRYVAGYEQKSCPLCGGDGWLAQKPEPVIETRQVGWRVR